MTAIAFRLLHPRRARARRHVTATWQRLITGDTTAIAEIHRAAEWLNALAADAEEKSRWTTTGPEVIRALAALLDAARGDTPVRAVAAESARKILEWVADD